MAARDSGEEQKTAALGKFLLPPDLCKKPCIYGDKLKTGGFAEAVSFLHKHVPSNKKIERVELHRTLASDFLVMKLEGDIALVVFANRNGIALLDIKKAAAGTKSSQLIYTDKDIKCSRTECLNGAELEYALLFMDLMQMKFECSEGMSMMLYMERDALMAIDIIRDGRCNVLQFPARG